MRSDQGAAGVIALLLSLTVAGCIPEATRSDTGPAQDRRAHVIERLQAGDAAVDGPAYTVISRDPLIVFFRTWTGTSPDPYCGYEFSADPSSVEPDPLGSGEGEVEAIGEGWYWLCAS